MIRPPGMDRVAFSERADGDLRSDLRARAVFSEELAISDRWATARQVHGDAVVAVDHAGVAGEADAVWTSTPGLPVAVFTADCFGVVLVSEEAVGVAHAGWRGARSGVVSMLRAEMADAGHVPKFGAVGPGIGSCCFEVGPEVATSFPDDVATTTWGTTSVDLVGSLRRQLDGVQLWIADACTFHEDHWFSHRRDATTRRLATVGWL